MEAMKAQETEVEVTFICKPQLLKMGGKTYSIDEALSSEDDFLVEVAAGIKTALEGIERSCSHG